MMSPPLLLQRFVYKKGSSVLCIFMFNWHKDANQHFDGRCEDPILSTNNHTVNPTSPKAEMTVGDEKSNISIVNMVKTLLARIWPGCDGINNDISKFLSYVKWKYP